MLQYKTRLFLLLALFTNLLYGVTGEPKLQLAKVDDISFQERETIFIDDYLENRLTTSTTYRPVRSGSGSGVGHTDINILDFR